MVNARLELNDALGRRVIPIDKPLVTIGRHAGSDVRLAGGEVSREHAEIVCESGVWVLRDRGSRYGTFVNEAPVTEHPLASGDRLQFGGTNGQVVVFLAGDSLLANDRAALTTVSGLRQLAMLLEGLRALGSGRVLDEVLALVLDAAIDVTGAERGFVMLAAADGALEMKLARARERVTLPGSRFDTSRKIPEEVFATGETRIVADLLEGELASAHLGTLALGIRHVACVPLRLVRYLDRADLLPETTSIGVLYLDSREKGRLLSPPTRAALDALAAEAGVAIENARLYRETLEKARIEHELRMAAEIQRALLPAGTHNGSFYEAGGASVQARTIGGDFYDLLETGDGRFVFLAGDVAGKGPAAALLTSKILGLLSAFIAEGVDPADTIHRVNASLARRAIGARYATVICAALSPDGELRYCSAGHNAALVFGTDGLRRLEADGPPIGLFDTATYRSSGIGLQPGDTVVLYSDGVTESQAVDGREFGEQRLVDVVAGQHGRPAAAVLSAIMAAVEAFAAGTAPFDDVTAVVVRYLGSDR